MNVVVIGGQSRNIGKTSLACGVINALPERDWTAVKITQFGHGLCAADGKSCDCAIGSPDHPYGISREQDYEGSGDTSRMLRAGAREVYWLRAQQGRLADAMPLLLDRISGAENVLLESNSVLDYLLADVYVPVIEPSVEDFKDSARRLMGKADAFAVVGGGDAPSIGAFGEVPRFGVEQPDYCSPAVIEFVRDKLTR